MSLMPENRDTFSPEAMGDRIAARIWREIKPWWNSSLLPRQSIPLRLLKIELDLKKIKDHLKIS